MDVIAQGRCLVRLLKRTTGPSFDGRTARTSERFAGTPRELRTLRISLSVDYA